MFLGCSVLMRAKLRCGLLCPQKVVLKEVYNATCDQDANNGGEDVLAVVAKLDNNKSLRHAAIDAVRNKLQGLRKHQVQVGNIELDTTECLQRIRTKGRKAFGNHIEDKLVVASLRGLSTAIAGRMKYLNSDTFFNRWPVPVVPVAVLPQAPESTAEAIFDLGIPELEAEDADDGEETPEPTTLDISDGHVIPFPHERHHLFMQEMMHVFQSEVVIDTTPGSGFRLLAVLLNNLRALLSSTDLPLALPCIRQQRVQSCVPMSLRWGRCLPQHGAQKLHHGQPGGVGQGPQAGGGLRPIAKADAPGDLRGHSPQPDHGCSFPCAQRRVGHRCKC